MLSVFYNSAALIGRGSRAWFLPNCSYIYQNSPSHRDNWCPILSNYQ